MGTPTGYKKKKCIHIINISTIEINYICVSRWYITPTKAQMSAGEIIILFERLWGKRNNDPYMVGVPKNTDMFAGNYTTETGNYGNEYA